MGIGNKGFENKSLQNIKKYGS